ncbi:MAG: SMP-30/gluconolactonase/LRE family protein [Candidatus Binatia bacterium]
MRAHTWIAIGLALAAVSTGADAGPLTQDPCPGDIAPPVVWKQLGNDVLENLLFADDSLWVSDGTRSSVLRLDDEGNEIGALTGIPSPGGLAAGSDGRIYAGWGNSAVGAVLRTGAAKVVRFLPADPNGSLEIYAEGFHMPNGMTFDPDGDLFISNDFDYGLVRIPSADPAAWEVFEEVWGTNGLVIDPTGENLYAAITFDQRSPIERIPLDASEEHETAVQLSFGVLSLEPAVHADPDPDAPLLGVKGLDDMTRDGSGILYVVANGTGELLRVDLTTGDACLLAGGLRNPSSVRIAPSGSPFDTSGESLTFYVVEFSGAIRRLGYTP